VEAKPSIERAFGETILSELSPVRDGNSGAYFKSQCAEVPLAEQRQCEQRIFECSQFDSMT
jgi:hypothetical protein